MKMAEQVSTIQTPREDSSYSQGLEKLVEEITCPVCQEFYHEPKLLPCLHYYCKSCLEELTLKGQQGASLSCPECRAECQLEVQKLPTAFFVNRMKSVYRTMRKAESQTELLCELCNSSQSPVKWFCRQCAQFICEFCTRSHRKLRLYKDHVVVSRDELSSTSRHLQVSKPKLGACEGHNQELKLFCFDCGQLICQDCTVIDHKNHNYEFVTKIASGIREKLTKKLSMLRNDQETLMTKKEYLTQAKNDVTANATDSSDFVNHSTFELIKLFENCRKELLEQIKTESLDKLEELSANEKKLTILSSELQNMISFIEKTLENETDDEIVSINTQILAKVDQQHEKCGHLEEPDTIQLSTSKEVCVAAIASVASTCIVADPDKCLLEIPPSQVGKPLKMKLLMRTTDNQPCHAKQLVNVTMRSLTKSIQCEVSIYETAPGMSEISFTPRSRGRHEIAVSINGASIAGSPFLLYVKPCIAQMQVPIQTIPVPDKLGDIAMSKKGEIMVTYPRRGTVTKLDKDTMKSETVASGLDYPVGIGVSKNNEVYVTESNAHCLRKFNQDFKSLGTVGQRGTTTGCFKSPGRLAVNYRGEVVVCDRNNSRIQIFDSKLRFQRWYGAGRPFGVACGKREEIFVTENSKNRVCRIYDKTLGLKEFCRESNSPQGVFVDEDYVYVTEACQVAVYKHSGQYIGSLGNIVLKNPHGITGDDDGYLYVCDKDPNAIFVF